MTPRPQSFMENYVAAGKLHGRKTLISGGDSGIGRAVAIAFAKEGADVAFMYLDEDEDAEKTKRAVEAEGRKCVTFRGDVGDPVFCRRVVKETVEELGGLNILVSNAAEQHQVKDFTEITDEQIQKTFATNIFGAMYLTREALKHLGDGDCIIVTSSVTAYRGSAELVDYASTKGALIAFTRSLSANLAKKGIRVNAVAPGPIWTPLIPASFDAEKTSKHGESAPMGRVGQPDEVAPSYVFLASKDASYFTGQVLHPNGGWVVNA